MAARNSILTSTTADRVRELLDYDPLTGVFIWRVKRNPLPPRAIAGKWHSHGYRQIDIDGTRYLAHRLAWLHFYGNWPTGELDHKNQVKHDNRIANLRLATRQDNLRNNGLSKNNTTGITGVAWHGSTSHWRAYITVNRRYIHLGNFLTKEKAAFARRSAEFLYFGEFASHSEVQSQPRQK